MLLEIKKLIKSFGAVKAVNNCSFNIEDGKITALIGPNGSGKTTIFNLISGILKADSGGIFFENRKINGLGLQAISNLGISRLFQQSRLFDNLTIGDNLLLAFDSEDTKFWKNLFGFNKVTNKKEERIKELLELIGLEKDLDVFAKNLSYGQKRLVEILRSIIKPHKLLMLDEPVSGVNPKLRNTILKILADLKHEGETIFLIEHDMNFIINIADKIIVMDEGKIIAAGKPNEIMKNNKVIEAYLG